MNFRVGITPDFYRDAKGRFEAALDAKLSGVPRIQLVPMSSSDLTDLDAIFSLGFKVDEEVLRTANRLALVARWGVGYDMIDTTALTNADAALAITPNAVRRPVAESVIALVFALTTNLLQQDKVVRAGKWRGDLPTLGRNIAGRTFGSVGFGNIGREVFRMAQSLGFGRLLATDPYATAADGVEMVSLPELLAASDFVSVSTPLNDQTRGLIGEAELRMMKPTAYLINTARGPIVNEAALIRALQERWIAGAGLDVFENEPLPAGSPLREMDNVVLSPHGLAWTEELVRDNGLEACDNILSVFRGELPASIVNKDVLLRAGFQQKIARFRSAT